MSVQFISNSNLGGIKFENRNNAGSVIFLNSNDTPAPTPTPTPSGADIAVYAKTSATGGGPYYIWYSVDNGVTYIQFPTALTTSCAYIGNTSSYPVGTTFKFFMADSTDPAVGGGWPTNTTSAGGICPTTTTLCTLNNITTIAAGTLTVWATGNQANPNAC